ncbi:hypothetical protein OROHE_017838 [Orobanche hederae]
MASAQVLRKQEHLEAGKRKLEEFRKKKAAEKAKKATSTSQPHASDIPYETQPSETERARLADSSGAGTSDAPADDRSAPSCVVPNIGSKESDTSTTSDYSSSVDTSAKFSLSARNNDINSSVIEHSYLNSEENKDGVGSMGSDGCRSAKDNIQKGRDQSSAEVAYGFGNDLSLAHHVSFTKEAHPSTYFTYHGLDNYSSHNTAGHGNDLSRGNSASSAPYTSDILPNKSASTLLPDKLDNSVHEVNGITSSLYQDSLHSTSSTADSAFGLNQKLPVSSDMGDKKFSGAIGCMGSINHSSSWTSDHKYEDYNYDGPSLSNHAPVSQSAAGRRSRPSFLDSIQIPSPALSVAEKAVKLDSTVYPVDGLGSSSGDGVGLFNNVVENKHNFFSQKQNEDFAALEQHIEDLTQEKFSLQRALDASRSLAESLASENSALTDSFNQQGRVVNQLQFDLEKLQEEIKAQLRAGYDNLFFINDFIDGLPLCWSLSLPSYLHSPQSIDILEILVSRTVFPRAAFMLVELEAVKIENANAQLECNAADERAKLLAAEVIGLEEKALRLRSNELKLERQLENTQSEISSCRRKMTTLEKDRQDLLSTIDALQEEKKLLQSKIRKASSGGKSTDFNKTSDNKKNASTSTEDLDISTTTESSNSDNLDTALLGGDAPGSQFSHENIHLTLEGLPTAIPPDQIRMIQNINTLVAELALEKDQLMQALSAESFQSSKLLELNKELSRKLEAQTQRLELLTAQSMANDNTQPRQLDPRTVHESTTYADEGDEVVERVLGWIMRLFPGGPSRRRPSKHL